ncbi:MAG: hypothetical protein FJY60_06200 [Betaproteobacteria bacterium]|nr:hypothetical protein [Betaproteobacteria bacterium]
MNNPSKLPRIVGFVDDVFRHQWWPAKEFFYEMLQTSLRQISGVDPEISLRRKLWAEDQIIGTKTIPPNQEVDDGSWSRSYEVLSHDQRNLLSRHIMPNAFYFGYELTPGLRFFLEELGVTYIDFRISPLRFLSDLVIVVRSNSRWINRLFHEACLPASAIEQHAAQLKAAFRYRQRMQGQMDTSGEKNSIIFVGQTGVDQSLIHRGRFLRVSDMAKDLGALFSGRHVVYLRHPAAAEEHVAEEIGLLRKLSPTVSVASQNCYDLLCGEQMISLVGISSGLLQEAAFFGRKAVTLHHPVCPLNFRDCFETPGGFYQFPFETFTCKTFLQVILGQQGKIVPSTLAQIRTNNLRGLHDVWWGYAEHRGLSSDFARIQQKTLFNETEKLRRTIQFIGELVSVSPFEDFSRFEWLTGRIWRWMGAKKVTFSIDGTVLCDGQPSGSWRVVPSDQAAALVFWDVGGWVDHLIKFDDAKMLVKNNIGDRFEVTALSD